MKLFRQLLLSLFPQEIIHQTMNPASMFVSFISPKQFFSVINRKIVENYKLNLFDIGLDPFEVRIGFGEQPTLNIKDIDMYYAYNATANMNGRNFYTPGNVGTSVSMVMALVTKDIFSSKKATRYTSFLVSVYLLTFVFAARIKVFPHTDKEKNYRWFIDVFFAFFRVSLEEAGQTYTMKEFNEIKSVLLKEIHLFFMLFYFYKTMNNLFDSPTVSEKEYYQRLFHGDLKKRSKQKIQVTDFILHAQAYTRVAAFSDQDRDIMKLVFPADVLIRYLLQGKDSFLVVENVVGSVYDMEKLQRYLHSFLSGDDQLEEFIAYSMDRRLFKAGYFTGLKQLTQHKFRFSNSYETSQEIDSFISSLEDNESLDGVKVPESLKKESMMMDRLVNFYVTYLGGMWVARGDNFALRLWRKDITNAILSAQRGPDALKQDALYFYGGLLYNYSKNLFYYTHAYKHIKQGNESFHLPLRPTSKEVYSNMFILKLFDENFIATLLQDINKKSIKIFVQQEEILSLVKKTFGATISRQIKGSKKELLYELYGPLVFFLQNMPHILPVLEKHLTKTDINILRDNVYTLDLQIRLQMVMLMMNEDIILSETYGDMSILGIFSQMRETLTGFLLWYTYLQQEEKEANIDLHVAALKKIYIVDVLNISERYFPMIDILLDLLLTDHKHLLQLRCNLDDNKKYFAIGLGNRMSFIEERTLQQISTEVVGEDIIWFRGYLKTIHYYNKRYIIPK